jgi:hypothetical protein
VDVHEVRVVEPRERTELCSKRSDRVTRRRFEDLETALDAERLVADEMDRAEPAAAEQAKDAIAAPDERGMSRRVSLLAYRYM